jgi:hypothetical protein
MDGLFLYMPILSFHKRYDRSKFGAFTGLL